MPRNLRFGSEPRQGILRSGESNGRRTKSAESRSFDGYRLQGQLAVIDHKIPEAIALFRKADATRPMQPEVILSLVRVLVRRPTGGGRTSGAGDDQPARNYQPIYDELYLIYAGSGRAEDAENILKTKVRNNPSDITADLELANHYVNVKKPAEMAATLKRLVDSPREFPGAPCGSATSSRKKPTTVKR